MWSFFRPLLIVFVILFLAFAFTRACVDETGQGYYANHYPGFIFIPGRGYYYDDRVRVRGGK